MDENCGCTCESASPISTKSYESSKSSNISNDEIIEENIRKKLDELVLVFEYGFKKPTKNVKKLKTKNEKLKNTIATLMKQNEEQLDEMEKQHNENLKCILSKHREIIEKSVSEQESFYEELQECTNRLLADKDIENSKLEKILLEQTPKLQDLSRKIQLVTTQDVNNNNIKLLNEKLRASTKELEKIEEINRNLQEKLKHQQHNNLDISNIKINLSELKLQLQRNGSDLVLHFCCDQKNKFDQKCQC